MSPTAFFLNPPALPGTTANREGAAGMGAQVDHVGGFVYPPHLLASAAAVMRRARWRVAGLDAVALGLDSDETLECLPQPDVLVLSVSWATLAADRAFLNRLRERKPLVKVLVIGPALSYSQVDHGLNDLADLLLSGEPDLALPAAARRLLAGDFRPGETVNPYTLAQGAYSPDGMLGDLDTLPLPAWEVFLQGPMPAQYAFLTLQSSRGCPAGCAYCPYVAAQGPVHRAQSPFRTADEMAFLAERCHPAHVMFRDPVFAYDRNRVLALCSELRHRNLGLSWECESRPEHFDGRLLRTMQAAGCTTVKLGLESTDPELLVAIGRVANEQMASAYLAQVGDVVEACRQLGMICRVFVMAGLPGQTRRAAELTARAIRRLQAARVHVKSYQWYPGIALPQSTSADVEDQVQVLQAAGRDRLSRWRRLAQRLPGKQATW